MVDSTDLTQVLHEAHDSAQRAAQKPTSAHVLLALFTVENRAQLLLKEKGVDKDSLLERMTSQPSEQDGLVRELCMRAREIAQSIGARETDCMHLLVAFTRVRCAASELMAKTGLHLFNLGNTALSYCLSGSMPMRLQPGRNSMAVGMPRPSRPLGARPSAPPASALAIAPRPAPSTPRAPSRPDLSDRVNKDALEATPPHLPKEQLQNSERTSSAAKRRSPAEQVDVLVITAVKDEYDAVLKVDAGALSGNWVVQPGPTGLDVAFRDFKTTEGGKLRVAVTRALDMGSVDAVNIAAPLVHTYSPRCIAMTGVCAGRRGSVEQGDVLIASRLWTYDSGNLSIEIDESGQRVERFQGESLSYTPPALWRQKAESFLPPLDSPWLSERPRTYAFQMDWMLERILEGMDPGPHPERKQKCPDYTKVLDLLWEKKWLQRGTLDLTNEGRSHIQSQRLRYPDGLPEPQPFRIHVGPIGTGNKVIRAPDIFNRLAHRERKLLGLEMEASALGAIAHLHQIPYVLVIKGVMDFADSEKDDHFKSFSARASAECLLAFLRENPPATDLPVGVKEIPTQSSPTESKSTSDPVSQLSSIVGKAKRNQIFISYCHKDEKWLKRLETHLRPLIRSEALDVWSDKRIAPGSNKREELEKAITRSKIAVLLVSPDYLASDLIAQNELTPLLRAAKQEGVIICWLPVQPSAYEYTELAKYKPLLNPKEPLSKKHHAYVNSALVDVVRRIKEMLQD